MMNKPTFTRRDFCQAGVFSLAPLAIAYMTYSAVTAEVFGVSRADIRPISSSPPPAMPKLPMPEKLLYAITVIMALTR